jgi:hypothetical protein
VGVGAAGGAGGFEEGYGWVGAMLVNVVCKDL